MWDVFGAKVRGAAHIKNESPCQDAVYYGVCGQYVIAAAADGHGSKSCPFSGEGAEAAVLVIRQIFEAIIAEASGSGTAAVFEAIDGNKELRLPRMLEHDWKQAVRELHAQSGRAWPEQADMPDGAEFPYILYGTTVMAVVACADFLFALQLGDGDILSISDGEAGWLIEPDYLVGNSTYSLCLDNAWQNVRTKMLRLDTDTAAPFMVMLTTDGYANSFATDDGFLKAGLDIAALLEAEGRAAVEEQLENWLSASSAGGSGDDITMAVLFRA